jgi:hypothetical protein
VLLPGGHADCLNTEKECPHEFLSISKAEEAYFKQKSWVQWLKLGDQNSSYFHKIIKITASQNLITHFVGWKWCEGRGESNQAGCGGFL